MVLADRALLEAVPVSTAREMSARSVMEVHVGFRLASTGAIRDGVDVVQRPMKIMMLRIRSAGRRVCGVLGEPDLRPFFDQFSPLRGYYLSR